jgi:fluoride ion exporter CrcB/FEX
MIYFLVFIGGGIGASLRFALSLLFASKNSAFPYSTLCVNLIGCFIAGIIAQYLMLKYLTTLHEALKRNWGNFCFVAIILINILIPAVINEQVERSFF